MLNATIEACLFAPPVDPTADSVRSYISTLLHWNEVISSRLAEVSISRDTQEVLIRNESYPLRPWLKNMMADLGIAEFDANTVARLAERIFERSAALEDETRIADVLFDDLTIDPDIFQGLDIDDLRWQAQRCAVILAIIGRLTSGCRSHLRCLVSRSGGTGRTVRLRCLIPVIEHSREDLAELPMAPDYFSSTFRVGQNLDACVLELDECKVLQEAETETDVENSIKIALRKYHRQANNPVTCWSLPRFRMNARFLESLRRCGAQNDPALSRRILRTVVEIVQGINMAATHAIRVGPGPNDRQVARNSDLAWRRDIDRHFHLHYWQLTDGSFEMSCVVPHSDMTIFF